ncbi:MAG: hypothetical protein IJI37_02345 [Opitutales bacterium]|nr:hypothetical protein [Opitutales bacterium]
MLAHLKDEIVRAGFRVEDFEIKLRQNSAAQTDDDVFDSDLRIVQQFMCKRPTCDSIHALAVLLKRSDAAAHKRGSKKLRAKNALAGKGK